MHTEHAPPLAVGRRVVESFKIKDILIYNNIYWMNGHKRQVRENITRVLKVTQECYGVSLVNVYLASGVRNLISL